jgi:spore maturation protein CgeB
MVFQTAEHAGTMVNVFDRNHDRLSRYFEFRFPKGPGLKVHPRVSHRETALLYKAHALSVNVNSVTDSETMCSRRLLEILACGGIMMTNPSPCIDKYFRDYCHVVANREEMRELFARMRFGPNADDRERAAAGAKYVLAEHTWTHRLGELCAVAGI